MRVYTLGYEGLSIQQFISRLIEQRIETVVDVRQLALSRRRGFSKTSLAQALEAAGIQYVYLRELGCPKPIRDAYRKGRDWANYARAYRIYLRGKGDSLNWLLDLVTRQSSCLMCYEADALRCHRSLVAEALENLSETVNTSHLQSLRAAWQAESVHTQTAWAGR
jgi:uncharacterized protein (DUF488 family)